MFEMPGELFDGEGNEPLRIDERLERAFDLPVLDTNHGNLDDATVDRTRSSGLNVNDGEGFIYIVQGSVGLIV